MLYFGVEDPQNKGHFFYDNSFSFRSQSDWQRNFEHHLIYDLKIDSGLCPKETKEGAAKLTYAEGLTFLAFWDYSGDSRPGSNSVFVTFGRLSFDQMLTVAKLLFPKIFARFTFEIKEQDAK